MVNETVKIFMLLGKGGPGWKKLATLSVSEMVCQRFGLSAKWLSANRRVSEMSSNRVEQARRSVRKCRRLPVPTLSFCPHRHTGIYEKV